MRPGRTFTAALLALLAPRTGLADGVPWPHTSDEPLAERFAPPPGARRLPLAAEHFGRFSRALPVRPGRGVVLLHDGSEKRRQDVHAAVLDIDVGARDLQQCADFALRLLAEHARAIGRSPCFRFTSGDPIPWARWAAGERPRVRGRRVIWATGSPPSRAYPDFRRWLDAVFTYAGSASVHRDAVPVRGRPMPGDLFVQPGFPGHVVVVLDVAEDRAGRRFLLLAQSFMPAQSPHVLRGPAEDHPWYPAPAFDEALVTPEWRFPPRSARRLAPRCRRSG